MPMSDPIRVADAGTVRDGEMAEVDAGGTPVLLARVGGRLHACAARCPHYGAPLATGVLDGPHVVCPWHHARFDVTTGALCDPPALDGLQAYAVEERDGGVFVTVAGPAHVPPPAQQDTDGRLFLVLGAGAAAQAAAEELRRQGFQGRIALATPEAEPPYDRTKLSKAYAAGTADDAGLPLRAADFQAARGIETWTGRTAVALDPDARTVTFEDGETVAYDACLVATGGTPRRLDVPGADLPGVFVLRSHADARALVGALPRARRAVVVGASFIGMEAASSLRERGLEVTVVDRAAVPLEAALGADVGRVFRDAAEAKGVAFRMEAAIDRIDADGDADGDAGGDGLAVVLASGERLPADVVVLGVGVTPATAFLAGHAFHGDGGGLETDAALRLADALFAAGDVAAVPAASGERVRIEHWRLAQQHGRAAARAMLGESEPFEGVPFFWSGQFGLALRAVGHAHAPDERVVVGSLADAAFVSYAVEGGRAVAALALGRDKDAAAFHHLLRRGLAPTAAEVRGGFDPQARLAEAQRADA